MGYTSMPAVLTPRTTFFVYSFILYAGHFSHHPGHRNMVSGTLILKMHTVNYVNAFPYFHYKEHKLSKEIYSHCILIISSFVLCWPSSPSNSFPYSGHSDPLWFCIMCFPLKALCACDGLKWNTLMTSLGFFQSD